MLQLPVELPRGHTPLEGMMIVLTAPAIGQALGLGDGGKQPCVQKLVPEPAVERLGKAVLPR